MKILYTIIILVKISFIYGKKINKYFKISYISIKSKKKVIFINIIKKN